MRCITAMFLQSKLRRTIVFNIMIDIRQQTTVLVGCVRRANERHASARLFAYLKLAMCARAILDKRQVAMTYAQRSLVRFVRMKFERNWIVRCAARRMCLKLSRCDALVQVVPERVDCAPRVPRDGGAALHQKGKAAYRPRHP
jgi:hypothetical protein